MPMVYDACGDELCAIIYGQIITHNDRIIIIQNWFSSNKSKYMCHALTYKTINLSYTFAAIIFYDCCAIDE